MPGEWCCFVKTKSLEGKRQIHFLQTGLLMERKNRQLLWAGMDWEYLFQGPIYRDTAGILKSIWLYKRQVEWKRMLHNFLACFDFCFGKICWSSGTSVEVGAQVPVWFWKCQYSLIGICSAEFIKLGSILWCMTGQALYWKSFLLRFHQFDALEVMQFLVKMDSKTPFWRVAINKTQLRAPLCALEKGRGTLGFVTHSHMSLCWRQSGICGTEPWQVFKTMRLFLGMFPRPLESFRHNPALCSALDPGHMLGVVHLRHTLRDPQKGFEHFLHLEHFQ